MAKKKGVSPQQVSKELNHLLSDLRDIMGVHKDEPPGAILTRAREMLAAEDKLRDIPAGNKDLGGDKLDFHWVPGSIRRVRNFVEDPLVRSFGTGATRSLDSERIDPEGTLSPLAIERYCEYMNKHRLQPDGTLRDTDNWQRGIPASAYMKGLWRHLLHAWQRHRGWWTVDPKAAADLEEDLCAVIFNAQGWLHELLRLKYQSGAGVGQEVKE